MTPQTFQRLFEVEDIAIRPGLDAALVHALGSLVGITLPVDHLDLLMWTNGAEGFGGYVRLFGFGSQSVIDLVQWNAENFWKFAWASRATPYFCFGETGWGDQYAYRIDQLNTGDPSVYLIDAMAMQPQKIAADFSEFFASEFLPSCGLPYDEMTVAARQRLGDLPPAEHVSYNPSPILGGSECVENVVKIASRSSMIIAGDLAIGVGALDAETEPNFRLDPYDDAEGRKRIKIVAC